MNRFILLSFFFLFPMILYAGNDTGIQSPLEPVVTNITIPDIHAPSMSSNGPEPLYIMKATVVYSDGLSWRGVIYLTNNTVITITNRAASGVDIRVLSIYSLESIRVVRWTAEKQGTNLYRFTPAEYRVVAVGTDTNGIVYTGNIPVFNQFVFSDDSVKKQLYTFFFDRWIEGKKGYFRWENSLATSFPYNFNNPLPGVVVEVDFDRNF
jgi:hypothetical protein